ncbi:hypothetical protein AB0I53_29415 [Saccharopolyspora sp. NPDC050389]|uniref:hypothetical protein n=1 Tax=Saccharopolyspora sp. NPDC050389 TaxID=3155516 RepID=UPI0033CEF196
MARRTVRELTGRLVGLGMVAEDKAAEMLARIGKWNSLDEELAEDDLFGWLPEFGIAISVHGEDVDYVEYYYRYLLEDEVAACTGGAVVVTDLVLVRDEDDEDDDDEFLHFLHNGEPVWWSVEHQSDDYADQVAVAQQIGDLNPGGDDPRIFFQLQREKVEACQDDVYVLASPEQARALRDEFDLDFHGLDAVWPRRGAAPTAEPGTVEWHMQEDRRYMTEPAKEFLDRWLSDMDGALDEWRAGFLPEHFPFDFSLDSLDVLGQLVLDRFPDRSAVREAAEDPFVVGAVRYLGETLIRNGPNHWACQDLVGTADDWMPMIRPNTPDAFQLAMIPLDELGHAAADRDPGILGEAAEGLRESADRYAKALRLLDSIRQGGPELSEVDA